MKVLLVLLAIVILAASEPAARVVPIGVSRIATARPSLHKRATYQQQLSNNLTANEYYTVVQVGTPAQNVTLIIDTGSSDTWVFDASAELCTNALLQELSLQGGCVSTFSPNNSSTYIPLTEIFHINYVSQGAEGHYFDDTFAIGGATVKGLQMALVNNTTNGTNTGILGLGFSDDVAAVTPYPALMDQLVEQNVIGKKAYSLYLNDIQSSDGTFLLGGIDTEKYTGDIITVPIINDADSQSITSFTVALSSLSIRNGSVSTTPASFGIPVVLDSGTSLSYLPPIVVNDIYQFFNAVDATETIGLVFVDCSYLETNITFNFQFSDASGPTIKVPVNELVLDDVKMYVESGYLTASDLPFQNACSLGIHSNVPYVLGQTFLRSAYVVYDMDDLQVGLAQTNFNATKSNIIEIPKGSSSIPSHTGVADQGQSTSTTVTVTTTGRVSQTSSTSSVGTGVPNNQGSTVASPSTSTSGNVGASTIPAPEWQAVGVAVVVGVCMLIGGGLLQAHA